jgi:hypothetical protein
VLTRISRTAPFNVSVIMLLPFLCSTLLLIVSILVPIETPVADMRNGGGVDWDFSIERRYGGDVSEIRLRGQQIVGPFRR